MVKEQHLNKMQNKIIIYESIESQKEFAVEGLEIYPKIKDMKIEVYVNFFDE